jgi:hypothetical protein
MDTDKHGFLIEAAALAAPFQPKQMTSEEDFYPWLSVSIRG